MKLVEHIHPTKLVERQDMSKRQEDRDCCLMKTFKETKR